MVHARTQKYSILVDEDADQRREQPMVALGDIATSKFVTRVMTDVESFCNVLVAGARAKYGNISVGSEWGAFSGVDGWSQRGPVTDA